jgi:hypothetical protein
MVLSRPEVLGPTKPKEIHIEYPGGRGSREEQGEGNPNPDARICNSNGMLPVITKSAYFSPGIKLRAELKLWDRGTRVAIKFDADAHSTTSDHHVEVLIQLRAKSLLKFHRLVYYLYEEGKQTTKSTADESAASELGILDLDGMAE